jgi:hypothetical protein
MTRYAFALRERLGGDVDALAETGLRDELGGDPERVALGHRLHQHHGGGRAGAAVQRAVVARQVGREHEVAAASVGAELEGDQREVGGVRVRAHRRRRT